MVKYTKMQLHNMPLIDLVVHYHCETREPYVHTVWKVLCERCEKADWAKKEIGRLWDKLEYARS